MEEIPSSPTSQWTPTIAVRPRPANLPQRSPKKSESQVLLEALCALYAINCKLRNTLNTTAAALSDVQNGNLQSAADSLDGPANKVDLGSCRVIGKVIGALEDVEGGLEGVVGESERFGDCGEEISGDWV
jgi:hypothetical protein